MRTVVHGVTSAEYAGVNLKPGLFSNRKASISIWLSFIREDLLPAHYTVFLADDEKEEIGRLQSRAKAREYVVSRAVIRKALSHAARQEVKPHEWRLEKKKGGKPIVKEPASFAQFQFNLSHCSGLVAVAVSKDLEVGLDIEPGDQVIELRDVSSVLTHSETSWIKKMNKDAQKIAILQTWTIKEAFLKLLGKGFSIDPRELEVVVGTDPTVHSKKWKLPGKPFCKSLIIHTSTSFYVLSLATWKGIYDELDIFFHLFDPAPSRVEVPGMFSNRKKRS